MKLFCKLNWHCWVYSDRLMKRKCKCCGKVQTNKGHWKSHSLFAGVGYEWIDKWIEAEKNRGILKKD